MSTANVTKLKRKAADFEQKKQLDKALALYIQLVDSAGRELDDADLQIYNRVGDLLMRQSNVSEALAYYEKAVDMYAERGYLNNAIALCNKILRQSPARTTVYYKLGKISANKGFKSDARRNFLEYADRMQKAGNTDEAFRSLKEFADLCPDQDDIRLLLADLLTKEQRTDEAVQQLAHLYAKLESEGREAEARATMERIKAIDPEMTPPVSGAYISQKSSDLVYLDLDEPGASLTRSSTPRAPTPVEETPQVVEVNGVGALEGLAVTFFPDEATDFADADDAAPMDGLEVNTLPEGEEVAPLPHLELVGTDVGTTPTEPLDGIEFDRPDEDELDGEDIVTPVEGLAAIGTTITDSHPSLAPLLDEPPMTGEEFGALELTVAEPESVPHPHDLALPSSLPRMEDEEDYEEPILSDPEAAVEPSAVTHNEADPDSAELASDGMEAEDSDVEAEADDEVAARIAAQLDALDDDEATGDAETQDDDVPFRPTPEGARPPAISPSVLAAIRAAHMSDNPDAPVDRSALSPEFALEEQADRGDGLPLSALDTSTLAEGLPLRGKAPPSVGPEPIEIQPTEDTPTGSSFGENRVELPMIDLAAHANDEFDVLDEASIDDLLSTPPTFTTTPVDAGAFEPSPLDFDDPTSTDEWEAQHPEVLIDGEWRDEHVGDLVSGEVFAVDDGADATSAPERPAAFDDLAAAMMYDDAGNAGGGSHTGAGSPGEGGQGNRRSTVTFGGTEAQLLRRLESDPANPGLRRQLGEALLDEGHRERGLNALELAVQGYEGQGAYASAREVVDVILRVSPLSVQHHQKRVEYAVRANDRAQLIGAYTDLADALFRCGEPDKSRVVYSRVLDLDPANDRARFALGMLSDDAGLPRQSEEIPVITAAQAGALPIDGRPLPGKLVIETEIPTLAQLSTGAPAAGAPHDASDANGVGDQAARRASAAVHDVSDAALDLEVDAAFAEAHALSDAPKTPKETVQPPAPADVASPPAKAHGGSSAAQQDVAATVGHEDVARVSELDDVASSGEHADGQATDAQADLAASKEKESTAPSTAPERLTAPATDHLSRDPAPRGEQDYVDLGAWLRASEPSRSTRMVSDDVVPTGDENADFAEMLRRFKQGVAANVEDEDYASHYDLGVAFKEMGLIDEAIAEFQKALRGDDHRVRAYEALGQCFVEQGQFQVASTLLRRALETTRADDQRLVGVLYLLGFSSESMGRHGDAVGYYQRVFAVDIEFRDVSSRLAALERKTQ